MTQMSSGPVVTKRSSASSNIYTVLVVVAFLALAVGIEEVCRHSNRLFGTSNPLEIVPTKGPSAR